MPGGGLKALEADEGLPEAHASMALVRFWYDWDWSGAEIEFERAIELNRLTYSASVVLLVPGRDGRLDESEAEGKRALELDHWRRQLTWRSASRTFCAMLRRLDTACERTLEIDPNFIPARYFLAQAYEQKGTWKRTGSV